MNRDQHVLPHGLARTVLGISTVQHGREAGSILATQDWPSSQAYFGFEKISVQRNGKAQNNGYSFIVVINMSPSLRSHFYFYELHRTGPWNMEDMSQHGKWDQKMRETGQVCMPAGNEGKPREIRVSPDLYPHPPPPTLQKKELPKETEY